MLSFKTALPLLALFAPFVAAQASQVDIEAIEAHFKQSGLEPDLINDFEPEALLNFAYGGDNVQPGTALAQSAVGSAPTLSVVGTTGDDFNSSATYTIALVDADVVGHDQSSGQTRHWLVNGATLSGSDSTYTINYQGVTTITDYAGPGPAEGSGAHRYVLLLIEQPADFAAPADLSAAGTPLGVFNIQQYIEQSKLGDIVAANYFTVENGVATSSAPATSTVNTATLSSASSASASASASTTSAGAGASASSVSGGVASSISSAAPASSSSAAPSSAASGLTPAGLNMGVIAGLMGVAVVTIGAGLGL